MAKWKMVWKYGPCKAVRYRKRKRVNGRKIAVETRKRPKDCRD